MRKSSLLQQRYRKDIDGIRALAVLSVFLFHLKPSFLPGGFLGVDVFFIISGYLISGIILRETYTTTFSFVNFYARRVKRIFPALFVVLLFTAVVAILLLPPETYSNYMRSARYASAQLANFFFSRKVGYFAEGFSTQPLLHTWSLGVEEQFYLFWPLFIVVCFRLLQKTAAINQGNGFGENGLKKQTVPPIAVSVFEKKFLLVLLLLFVLSYLICRHLIEVNYNLAFYMFYTRAFEFCIGGFIALRILPQPKTPFVHQILGGAGILLIVYAFFFVEEEYLGSSFLYGGVLIPCIGTALIIHSQSSASVVNRMLATQFPSFIGRISYSLYLYHWPVIIFWKFYSNREHLGIQACLTIFLISIILATLSYRFVEQPARKRTGGDKYILMVAALVIVCFTLSFKYLEDMATVDWRISRFDPVEADVPLAYAPQCNRVELDHMVFFQCVPQSPAETPTIALAGDSHALHYLRATTAWAHKRGYNVKYLGTAGCPMLFGEIHLQQRIMIQQYAEQCSQALPVLQKEILDDPNVQLVLYAQRFELLYDGKGYSQNSRIITFKDKGNHIVENHTNYYRKRLSDTVEAIKDGGKKLILLHQVPLFNGIDGCNWQPLAAKIFSKQRQCSFDERFIDKWQQPSIDFINDFANEHNIDIYDPFKALTSPLQNNVNIYQDIDHINNLGFSFLVPHFSQEMDKLMKYTSGELEDIQ